MIRPTITALREANPHFFSVTAEAVYNNSRYVVVRYKRQWVLQAVDRLGNSKYYYIDPVHLGLSYMEG
jgi:hypothetical protein